MEITERLSAPLNRLYVSTLVLSVFLQQKLLKRSSRYTPFFINSLKTFYMYGSRHEKRSFQFTYRLELDIF